MRLTKADLLTLLDLLAEETLVVPTDSFPYRISRHRRVYSEDKVVGPLQAKLSMMLELTTD